MTLVSPSQSNPKDEIRASSINDPINELAAVINGNIDDTNIAGLSGSKLSNGSVTPDKLSTGGLVFYTGSGSYADGATFKGWSASETATGMFTYSSSTGLFSCKKAGVYRIDLYVVVDQASAGVTANNEFVRVKLDAPGGSNYFDINAARSTVWRGNISIARRFAVNDTVGVSAGNSAGLTGNISYNLAVITITRVL